MSQPGETRAGLLNIVAACIVAGGFVGTALITTHRPASVASGFRARSSAAAPGIAQPPITQAAAALQLRTQVLAAPSLHKFVFKKATFTLADVKVTQAIYDARADEFTVQRGCVWEPVMPQGGPKGDSTILSSDGYGHYSGSGRYDNAAGEIMQSADVTIK